MNAKVGLLAKKMKAASEAYYAGNPIILDAEFDLLSDELRALDPNHPELKKVGDLSVSVWPEVAHEMPMGSQLKVNSFEELTAWYLKNTNQKELCWSEKLDGSSIELLYMDGEFKQAITRGDGFIGEDITPNVLLMGGFPKKITFTGSLSVRGEIMLYKDVFSANFPGEKNPRNSAAGTARRKHDNSKCKFLTVLCYNIVGYDFYEKSEIFMFLEKLGFTTPEWGIINNIDKAQVIFTEYQSKRDSLRYEIDGLIFEEHNLEKQAQEGEVDNRPKAQRAYKFESMTATSKLEGIVLQTGRTGVITPVAEITPTEIGGVTVSRISLMNFAEVRSLGINIGDEFLFARMNDVIPRIIAVTNKQSKDTYEPPMICPECGKALTEDGAAKEDGKYIRLLCTNDLCSGRLLLRIENYVKTIGVKGLGDKILEKLYENGKLKTIADLYTLSVDDIASLEGSGEKTAKKLITQIQQKSQLTLPEFIDAIGLVGVGEHITELLQDKYPTLEALRAAKVEDIVLVKGVGELLAKALVNGLVESTTLIDDLLRFVTIKQEKKAVVVADGALAGKAICFTGCRPDNATKEKIEALGGKVASGVSKRTTHLVCMDTNSNSGKAKEARELGLTIMSEADFLGWLGTM